MTIDWYKYFKEEVLETIPFEHHLSVVDVYWFIIRKMVETIDDKYSHKPTLTHFPIEMKDVVVIVGNAVNDGYMRYGHALNIYVREK